MDNNPLIPRTVDGSIIYPGMEIYLSLSFSINKFAKDTVFAVLPDNEIALASNVSINEDTYDWDFGNLSHVSRLFATEAACIEYTRRVEELYDRK